MFNLIKRERQDQTFPIRSLQRKVDDLFNNFFEDSSLEFSPNLVKSFRPHVNISEDEKAYYIEVEIAGIKKEDVKLKCNENGVLSIAAEKKEEHQETNKNYHCIECFNGSFYRSFQMPENVDRRNIRAEMKDGILKISLQKTNDPNQKSSEIKIN